MLFIKSLFEIHEKWETLFYMSKTREIERELLKSLWTVNCEHGAFGK